MKSTKPTQKNLLITRQDKILAMDIFEAIEEETGINHKLFINNRKRKNRIVTLRQIATHLLIEYSSMSLGDIGFLLGGFDHSTIIHTRELVSNWLDHPKMYASETSIINNCKLKLSEKYEPRTYSNTKSST